MHEREILASMRDDIYSLRRERDERQALLEKIMGTSCDDCSIRQVNTYAKRAFCDLSGFDCPDVGRRYNCPFLPFEKKKVSLKPVDEIFAKHMTPEEMKRTDDEADKERK